MGAERNLYQQKAACNYIEQKASDAGLDTLDRSLGNMRSMFEAAEKDIRSGSASHRSDQLKWQTFVQRLRRKISRERASITLCGKPIVRFLVNITSSVIVYSSS
jgi:hypothetical protein